jgi:hypothetical protein
MLSSSSKPRFILHQIRHNSRSLLYFQFLKEIGTSNRKIVTIMTSFQRNQQYPTYLQTIGKINRIIIIEDRIMILIRWLLANNNSSWEATTSTPFFLGKNNLLHIRSSHQIILPNKMTSMRLNLIGLPQLNQTYHFQVDKGKYLTKMPLFKQETKSML